MLAFAVLLQMSSSENDKPLCSSATAIDHPPARASKQPTPQTLPHPCDATAERVHAPDDLTLAARPPALGVTSSKLPPRPTNSLRCKLSEQTVLFERQGCNVIPASIVPPELINAEHKAAGSALPAALHHVYLHGCSARSFMMHHAALMMAC